MKQRMLPETDHIHVSFVARETNGEMDLILPSLTSDIDPHESYDILRIEKNEVKSHDDTENIITQNPIKVGLGDVLHLADIGTTSSVFKPDGYDTYIRHLKYYVQDIWYLSETMDIYLYVYCHCEDFNYMYKILPYLDENESLYPGYGIFDKSNERYDLIRIEPLSFDEVTQISISGS